MRIRFTTARTDEPFRFLGSWCSGRIPLVLGRGDNGSQRSLPPFSHLDVPLRAQHLHLLLPALNTSTLRPSEGGSIQHLQPETKMLDCERYIGVAGAGHSVRWCAGTGYDPPPRTLTAPLGGGGRPAMQWAGCCPPTGAQVASDVPSPEVSGRGTCLRACLRDFVGCRGGSDKQFRSTRDVC